MVAGADFNSHVHSFPDPSRVHNLGCEKAFSYFRLNNVCSSSCISTIRTKKHGIKNECAAQNEE
jgi:hypothetical protein